MQELKVKREILRILDANLNRAREGLRVCEEITRFSLNSASLTRDLKNARHRIQNIYSGFPSGWRHLVGSRNTRSDVGRGSFRIEMKRGNVGDIFFANIERAKESARVLEEFLKLFDSKLSSRFKGLRFSLYEIEKKAARKL